MKNKKFSFIFENNLNNLSKDNILDIINLNISIFESHLIEYILGLRKIIKLEGDMKNYNDEYINKILDKYGLLGKIIYGRILFPGGDSFIVFGKDKLLINEFLYYNFSNNIVYRSYKTGIMLGYPKCCIKNYISFFNKNPDTSSIDDKIFKKDNNNEKSIYKLGNFLLNHVSCQPICKESKKIIELKLKFIINNIDFFKSNFYGK